MFQRLVSQILLPVLIVAIGAGGLVWLSTKDAPPERVAKQPSPLLVETIPLQASTSSFPIHVGGNVVPRREVTLSAEVAGAVTFKGDSIESGPSSARIGSSRVRSSERSCRLATC